LTKKNPGPGAYNPEAAIKDDGLYHNSKFKNSGAMHFNPPKSKRFDENTKGDKPGPGAYDVRKSTGIKEDGKYVLSNMRSSKCRTFSHEMRKTLSSGSFLKTPGPGAYRLPSEFGYYEARASQSNFNSV